MLKKLKILLLTNKTNAQIGKTQKNKAFLNSDWPNFLGKGVKMNILFHFSAYLYRNDKMSSIF